MVSSNCYAAGENSSILKVTAMTVNLARLHRERSSSSTDDYVKSYGLLSRQNSFNVVPEIFRPDSNTWKERRTEEKSPHQQSNAFLLYEEQKKEKKKEKSLKFAPLFCVCRLGFREKYTRVAVLTLLLSSFALLMQIIILASLPRPKRETKGKATPQKQESAFWVEWRSCSLHAWYM